MSSSLSNLYMFYNSMKMYANYSLDEIDNMLPFERSVYHGLVLEEKDKQKQNKGG